MAQRDDEHRGAAVGALQRNVVTKVTGSANSSHTVVVLGPSYT